MFAFQLAARMGWVDVDAMLDGIGERQFGEWMAFNRLQPFTDERFDLIMALGFASLINSWGGKVKVQQLMPFTKYRTVQAESKAREQIAIAQQIALMAGASPV